MREVGLLDVRTDAKGGVGRPQHRYSLAAEAPSLGLEPPSYPLLARLLLETAAAAGVGADEAAEIGREQGRHQSARYADAPSCLEALVRELEVLGFDPAVDGTDDGEIAVIAFTHCPFRELAEAHPELVCALHRGMVEGFVEQAGEGSVDDFHTLAHREPCQVMISSR
jgi:predicted ArsR family transcriptional regulator